MEAVLSHYSASISEFKRNPSRLIEEAGGETIAILNHNKPTAYLVPAATYAALTEVLEDIELGRLIEERRSEKSKVIKVSLDEL